MTASFIAIFGGESLTFTAKKKTFIPALSPGCFILRLLQFARVFKITVCSEREIDRFKYLNAYFRNINETGKQKFLIYS